MLEGAGPFELERVFLWEGEELLAGPEGRVCLRQNLEEAGEVVSVLGRRRTVPAVPN